MAEPAAHQLIVYAEGHIITLEQAELIQRIINHALPEQFSVDIEEI